MKLPVLCGNVLLTTAFSLFAYEEWSIPHLSAPTVLEPLSMEVQVQHQFWGRVDGKARGI